MDSDMSDDDFDRMVMDDDESDFSFGKEDEENKKPVVAAKATKKAVKSNATLKKAAPKKKAAAPKTKKTTIPVDDDEDEESVTVLTSNSGANIPSNNQSKKNKTVEETYQKMSQLEHILKRPDTYIGSVQRFTQTMYVLNDAGRIVEKEITFTPGLYKIFDEIVVNAADNKQRDPNMDMLDITIDAEKNVITVKNNGKGIPIVQHKVHNVYVPTLIFGHLLTGSNFDDDEKKTTGGRNGYGAKLANVFSTEFVVECVDTENGIKFRQVFRNNMTKAEEPVIKNLTEKEKKAGDSVQISFSPDLPKFQMDRLDDDIVSLMSKRAYDIAGSMANRPGKSLKVSLNGKKLPIKSFKDYLSHFEKLATPVAYTCDERWEVGVACSIDETMQHISFVNAISTSKGGHHVTYIADQVANHLITFFKKKKKMELKKNQIVAHLAIMVNALIENPSFDSQTKENLTTRPKQFGSKFTLPDDFLKKIEKSDIVEKILNYAKYKSREALKRKGGVKKIKLTGIAKLEDANFAGSARSKDCTLIITEGDSAKSLAMAGMSVVGRDYYGVFPLRGKMKNVRNEDEANAKNVEVKNLVDILGLKYYTTYDESNIKTLRYGHLMIMADQDTDGSHIKGLVINILHHFWPSLLDVPGFLQQMITPIVKVSKGKKSRSFFSIPEYRQWLDSTGNNGRGYTIKYYKGLGTSTSAEAKEYFSNLKVHQINFAPLSTDVVDKNHEEFIEPETLPDTGAELIDMVFKKDRVAERKNWLLNTKSNGVYLDYSAVPQAGLKYSEFINKEYVLFSNADNERSIPHIMDGFKTSQRKVMFGCFKRKLYKNEIKVAQLVGYVAEHSAYHHGEMSLQETIVKMAQNYVGSNNINLLVPSGQFGTRRMGGKDHASARYIFTKVENITRLIFHPDDDDLLEYLTDDGVSIEPEFYMPVIPMVLVNGSDGIGTGWSTKVCNYSPRQIIENLRRKIAGEAMIPMEPYYEGFTGEIIREKQDKFITMGKIERIDDETILITELPVKKWTQDYKEFLEAMLETPKEKPDLKDMRENHTETSISFTLIADKEKIDAWEQEKNGLYAKFKLSSSISSSNMMLYDTNQRITKYDTPEDIMNAFYEVRLEFYVKRKANLVRNLEAERKMLSNKARFVEEVCAGHLIVSNRKRTDLLADLQERGYDLIMKDGKNDPETADEQESEEEEETSIAELAKGYEYLLGMKIWSLTFEKAEELRAQLQAKTQELDSLQATPPQQIWLNDLAAIEEGLDQRDADFRAAEADERRAQKKSQKYQKAKGTKSKGARKKKKNEWDSEAEESDIVEDPMDMSESDDELFMEVKKPVSKPVAKAPMNKATVKAQVKGPAIVAKAKILPTKSKEIKNVEPTETSDSDNEDIIPLSQRLQNKLLVSPPTKAKKNNRDSNSSSGTKTSKKRPSPEKIESDQDEEIEVFMPTEKPKATTTKRSTAKAKPAPKKGATKKKIPPKKKVESYDLEDSDDFNFHSSEDEKVSMAPSLPVRAPRRAAAAAKSSYKFDDSSSEEDNFDDE